MYRRENRPHKQRYDKIIVPSVKPYRIEYKPDDEDGGQGIDEIQKLKRHSPENKSGDDKC